MPQGINGSGPQSFPKDTTIGGKIIGNLSDNLGVSVNTTLDSSVLGRLVWCQGVGGYTLKLPVLDVNQTPSGAVIEFFCTASSVVIERSSTDNILPNNVGVASLTLRAGDTLRLVAAPASGVWIATVSSAQLRYASDFGASLSSTGWQRLPSGLIMQWILDTSAFTAGVERVISLPLTFPVGIVCATFAPPNTSGSAVLSQRWVSASQIGVTASAAIAGGAGTSIIVLGR